MSVRVRFAPSPTGYLHIGGLRTALYNYLFARHHGGRFLLRIEDTDQSRKVEGAMENLLETLRWVGLEYDEGPDCPGEVGPYIQSDRLVLYRNHVDELLAKGNAYPCFCSEQELEDMRARQVEEKRPPMYDRRCRALRPEEVQARLSAGTPHTVRMKAPLTGEVVFQDVVRGEVRVGCKVIDDQVLLKSDGFPTYHLANVVDDHSMGITHVIRGEEWLPSTSKHVLLYEFLGWQLPVFAHLPLLLNADRSKLSKRQGDVAVEDYRAKGFLPSALLNYVSLLGWNTTDNREFFTKDDLIREFSLDRVGKSGAVFDIEKLRWFNAHYLRALPTEELRTLCLPWLQETGWTLPAQEKLDVILSALVQHLTLPSDIVEEARIFFTEPESHEDPEMQSILADEASAAVFTAFLELAPKVNPWHRDALKLLIKQVQQESGRKGKELFMPLRIALTARLHGPELPVIMEILGKEIVLRRIAALLP